MTIWKNFILQDKYMDAHDFENPTHRVPVDFNKEVNPASVAMNPEAVRQLIMLFDQRFKEGLYRAAQLVVLRHGQVIIDRFAGSTQNATNLPVDVDTPFFNFSTNKAFTAMCVHKLIELEKIEWDAPVAEYWPEFGQKGKEKTTIRQVFTHRSGIGQPHIMRQIWYWPFWKRVTRDIANTPAEFIPGEECSYQTVNFGFIMGEIIRRVTGMDAGQYMHKMIFEPLGMHNSYLPIDDKNLKRSPRLTTQYKEYRKTARVFNLPIIRKALIPAASMHSSAHDLAVFYQMLLNGGEYAGKRLFEPETIGRAISPGYQGPDRTLKTDSFWAHGFHLGGVRHAYHHSKNEGIGKRSSESTFAHYGMSTSMAWADWREQVVVAFTCSHRLGPENTDTRWNELNDLVWTALS